MRNTIQFIAACLLFMNTGASAEDVTPGDIDEVSLAYSSGWVGRLHKIWVKSDGTAIYRGDHKGNRIGIFQSKLSKGEFLKLAAYLVDVDFESFEKEYNRGGTDGSSALITVKHNKTKWKNVSVQQLLNYIASLQGLDLSVEGRTVTIRKRSGSL